METISEKAKEIIYEPISDDDVEIEIIYSTKRLLASQSDVDNILKPILDALTGVAYKYDKQVRCVTSTVFDQRVRNTVEGDIEDLEPLFYTKADDVVTIRIYSDRRLEELGGADEVAGKRRERHLREVERSGRTSDHRVRKARPPE